MLKIPINVNLELRLLLESDAENIFKSIQKNRAYLEEFMPRISENQSILQTKKVIRDFINQLIQNTGFRVGIFYDMEFVGIIGLKYIDWINKKTEIMYWVDQDFSRKGIATNCVLKIVEICFNYFDLNKIILITSIRNIGSQKVAEKCGFKLEAILREDELLNTGFENAFLYSILKTEYIRSL